jgi:hypothetical protein
MSHKKKGIGFDHFVKQKSRLGLCRLCVFGNMREDSANEWAGIDDSRFNRPICDSD